MNQADALIRNVAEHNAQSLTTSLEGGVVRGSIRRRSATNLGDRVGQRSKVIVEHSSVAVRDRGVQRVGWPLTVVEPTTCLQRITQCEHVDRTTHRCRVAGHRHEME